MIFHGFAICIRKNDSGITNFTIFSKISPL